MAQWIDHVAEYLEDQLTGHARGTTIFTHHLPDSPNAAICLYDGGTNTAPQGPDVPLAEYVAEVRVRSTSASAAETLMTAVRTHLHFKGNLAMDTSLKVRWSRAIQEPALIEYDAHRRAIYLCRFVIVAERSDTY